MATRSHTGVWIGKGVYQATWTGLLNTDVGDGISLAVFDSYNVQVKGTVGAGGTVVIEGSNDAGSTYAGLNDTRGESNALSFTAADIRAGLERPALLRPNVTAGDGTTNFSVIVTAHKSK